MSFVFLEKWIADIKKNNVMKCVYCQKEITTKSSEHVIQNAIGGILESEDICCPECNLAVEKFVDKDFVKIFSPITKALLAIMVVDI